MQIQRLKHSHHYTVCLTPLISFAVDLHIQHLAEEWQPAMVLDLPQGKSCTTELLDWVAATSQLMYMLGSSENLKRC